MSKKKKKKNMKARKDQTRAEDPFRVSAMTGWSACPVFIWSVRGQSDKFRSPVLETGPERNWKLDQFFFFFFLSINLTLLWVIGVDEGM